MLNRKQNLESGAKFFSTVRKASCADVENAAKMANAHMILSQHFLTNIKLLLEKGESEALRRSETNSSYCKGLPAASALDAQSEYLVQDTLDSLMKESTVCLCHSSLSTVKTADTMAVVSEGQTVEIDTHQKLLSNHGIYTCLEAITRNLRNNLNLNYYCRRLV
ncbi:hypothetical protein F8388_019542 [Cannabis sativa]|uniref:Uncharacterized protein n=1 Tax=Cannabis sativa TaxID=3483 RepID=A0A7J6HVA8_CANSA|nr:hypothetical protein F8388_019542 [Cannabis sativa]KAF4398791.1 hypothetical protein G4B88_028154 [Cannabis sativa]